MRRLAAFAAMLLTSLIAWGATPLQNATITGVTPRGCIAAEGTIVVTGAGFGAPGSAKLAVQYDAVVIELDILAWSETRIQARMPRRAELDPGRRLVLGLRKARGSWISNTDHAITLCASPAAGQSTTPGEILNPSPSFQLPSPRMSGGAAVQGRGDVSSGDTVGRTPIPSYADDSESMAESTGELSVMPEQGGSGAGAPTMGTVQQPKSDPGEVDHEPGELVTAHDTMENAKSYDAVVNEKGGRLVRRRTLKGLGMVLSTYRFPEDESFADTVKELAKNFNGIGADLNARFSLLGAKAVNSQSVAGSNVGWKPTLKGCSQGKRIGMLDTEVYTWHDALMGRVTTKSLVPTGVTAAPQNHGTAIATILTGSKSSEAFAGLAPAAQLFAGSVFRQDGKKTYTNAEWLVLGLDWLVTEGVSIINLSLGGPYNSIVEAALQRVFNDDILIVAAAGSDGKGQPLYPAYMPGVIAVTAVDAEGMAPRKTPQGGYISFAAPGIDVWAGATTGGGSYYSGSSFATPYVTAALIIAGKDGLKNLGDHARDLGAPGHDEIYGWGLIQFIDGCTSQ